MFFRAVRKHVEDPDLDLYVGVLANDMKLVKSAAAAGANVNVTDAALWSRYNMIFIEHQDVYPAWRKLFLHFVATGQIRGAVTPKVIL